MLPSSVSSRLEAGARLAQRRLSTVMDQIVLVPDPERLVHLQFRRFAGCPDTVGEFEAGWTGDGSDRQNRP